MENDAPKQREDEPVSQSREKLKHRVLRPGENFGNFNVVLSQYFETQAKPGQQGMDPERTMRILAELLGVLGYAHTHGIDHRDIDSDMVLIQENGSLCILGLGVKAALGTEHFEAIVSASVSPLISSKTQGRLNSFDVMSPEYQAGIPEDSRVDLFCVGVIGYWLITGRKPDRKNPESPSSLREGVLPKCA